MTATNLGLGGKPVKFLGAYVFNLNTSLGLEQSPSTCTVQLVEDRNPPSVPGRTPAPAIFEPPEMGSFHTLTVGSLVFSGVVTGYEEDVSNIQGKQIAVNLSDPREIMDDIPIIIGPGYSTVADIVKDSKCSIINAFDAFSNNSTGFNLVDWNQSGMTYGDIALAFQGGLATKFGVECNVKGQEGRAFGETYLFDLSEVTEIVDVNYRVNTNLISVTQFIQEMADRHSFDWYVESERNVPKNRIDVKVKVIDRSVDNIDIDLDNFLIANSGFVQSAKRGFELRNDLACPILMGARVEQMFERTITGLANNSLDLSSEGGSSQYQMDEEEMRCVLTDIGTWRNYVQKNGGYDKYKISKTSTWPSRFSPADDSDLSNQFGLSAGRIEVSDEDYETGGKLFEKLEGHAQATYGKRFMFTPIFDVEVQDAAWTGNNVIANNNDPNEYFRNDVGKTRCYVEFAPSANLTPTVPNPPSFTAFSIGANAPTALPLELKDGFNAEVAVANVDKSDWIIQPNSISGDKLYVAATIEANNVVKLSGPVFHATPDNAEGLKYATDAAARGGHSRLLTSGSTFSNVDRQEIRRFFLSGGDDLGLISQKAFQPTRVFVPTVHSFLRYGPVHATKLGDDSEGKVVIDKDDGFAPWEFGSDQAMFDAMKFKVDNAASNVKTVEKATIVVEGLPKLSIGDSLGKNSNINNISVAFGGGGVNTTYQLSSFLREFGELSKQELGFLSLIARRSGTRVFPQDAVSFINKFRPIIAKQFAGKGSITPNLGGGSRFE